MPFVLAIKPQHPIHLEIQRRDTTPVGILRTTFRDPVSGQLRHTTHERLTGMTLAGHPTSAAVDATGETA